MNKHANTEQIKIIGKLVAKLQTLGEFNRSDYDNGQLSFIDNAIREYNFYRPVPSEAGTPLSAGAERKPARAPARV